jgi:choline-phosphate cytidylyltransferase
MNDIRDNIKTNWSTTGQELTKELRQFWQNSRPGSPARGMSPRPSDFEMASGMRSPSALAHLNHLDIPKTGANHDFATGFTLGLIGGVRSWVSFDFIPGLHLRLDIVQELTDVSR